MATEWMEIDYAIANMGEDDERVLGMIDDAGVAHVCWWSCGNIKMADVTGISGFTMASPSMTDETFKFLGSNSDFEVAIPVMAKGMAVMIAIDCCDCVTVIGGEDVDVDAECTDYDPSDSDLPDEIVEMYELYNC